jgi:hypothetical protein
MSSSGSFHYVQIPADDSLAVIQLEESKAGGLSDDALVKNAKAYFQEQTGAQARVDHIQQAGPDERKALAAQIRSQLASTPQAETVDSLDDDTVIRMIYESQTAISCDISAITVPMVGNSFVGVSMYMCQDATSHNMPTNQRATALLAACGHTVATPVSGDCFVGRYHDNEKEDVWDRMDFTAADADSGASWCQQARNKGGGGGSGKAAAASLGNLVQQQQKQMAGGGGGGGGGNMQVIDTSGGTSAGNEDTSFGANGAPAVVEEWGSWTQKDDEVELKLSVAKGTKAKYCKMTFERMSLKVIVAGQVFLQGTYFDPVHADESTFTLEDEGDGRALVITLVKNEKRTWAWAVKD